MRSKASIQKEINRLKKEIEPLTTAGKPIEGYEAEYQKLQERLAHLREEEELATLNAEVDSLELRLRELIHRQLSDVIGPSYWKSAVPGDVKNYTKTRITQHLESHPYQDWSSFPPGRERLNFCDIDHYGKIIQANWEYFEDFFRRKEHFRRHLDAYRTLRNALKHNRRPSDIERDNGRAAIRWLRRILAKYEERNSPLNPEALPLSEEAPRLSQLLEEAQQLTEQEQFTKALEALEEARRYAGEHEDRLAIVAEQRRRANRAREVWKQERADSIEEALKDTSQPLPDGIETWIEEYRSKAPEEESRVQAWLERVTARRRLDEATKAAQTLRQELEPIWAECEQAIGQQEIVAAAEAAQRALDLARELKRECPEAPPVEMLVEEAKTLDERARGPAVTAVKTAQFEKLLEEYQELKQKGHDELPSFKAIRDGDRLSLTTDELGQEILNIAPTVELAPAEGAIREIETLATEYALEKAESKLELAKQAMPHDPRRASALLEEARRLFVPPSRREDTQWVHWIEKVEEYNKLTVEPAVARREKAESRRDAALSLPDVLAAWDELGEVERLDPHTPLLKQARGNLLDRLIFRTKEALQRAQDLRRRRCWKEAQQTIESLLIRTRQDERLKEWTQQLEEFVQGCEERAQAEQSTLEALREIKDLVDEDKIQPAHEQLTVLERQLGEDADAYTQVGRLRNRIDAKLDLQTLLDRAALVHDSAASDEEFETALEDLEEALKEHKAHPEILALEKRLRARLRFRRAERGREVGTASLSNLRTWYRSVISLGGEDVDQAEKRLSQISKEEEETEKTEQTLRAATGHLEDERYREALDLLEPLSSSLLPQHRRVWELFDRATEGLIEKIEGDLRELEGHKRRRLDTVSILDRIEDLTEVEPERARDWSELEARCYMQMAKEASSHSDAIRNWREARKCIPPNSQWHSDIVEGLRQAEKRRAFAQVDVSADAPNQARGLLEQLLTRYPDDPEVRLRLVQCYIRDGKLRSAREQLASADRLLRRAAVGDARSGFGLSGQLAEVREQLEKKEHLQAEKRRIETCLTPAHTLRDFQWAKKQYNQLKRQETSHRRDLEDWWENLTRRVIEELEADWKEQQERNAPLWKAAQPMLKILELRNEHGQARDVLDQIARKSLDLRGKVERAIHQTTGPLGVPAAKALKHQINEVRQLLEEAQAYREIFQRRGGDLNNVSTTDLDESIRHLRDWRDRLVTLNARLDEIRGLMSTAMHTGERRLWEQGEEWINQISGTFNRSAPRAETSRHVRPADAATFAAHRTVRVLIEDFETAKETRERLEGYIEELPRAWAREDFACVRQLIEEIRREDPKGQKFNLANRHIPIDLRETRRLKLDQLEKLVAAREEQLSELQEWATAARQVAPWRALPPTRVEKLPDTTDDPEPSVVNAIDALQRAVQSRDYSRAGSYYKSLPLPADSAKPEADGSCDQPLAQLVEEYINQANFKRAFKLCLQVLCGSHPPAEVWETLKEEYPDLRQAVERWNAVRDKGEAGTLIAQEHGSDELWSLLKAKQWLEEPPLDTGDSEDILSCRAALVVARGMALGQEIDVWTTDAQARLESIPETQRRLNELLKDARDCITRADELRRWWQKKERNQFLEAAQAALDEAGKLCPDSVDREELQDLLNSMW